MPARHVTLFIPELFWPDPEDGATLDALVCPALAEYLARGRLTRRPLDAPQSIEAALCRLFARAAETRAAYAAWRRLGENASGTGEGIAAGSRWLCADPVHLRLSDEGLFLVAGKALGITVDEAHEMAHALNAHCGEIGRFHFAEAGRGYLNPAEGVFIGLDAPPLGAVAGRIIGELLPEILVKRDWRRQMNDMQTLLHSLPLNRRRAAENRPRINSLWLWGEGEPFDPADGQAAAFNGLWSADPLARGLARAAHVPTAPLPETATAWLAAESSASHALFTFADLSEKLAYADGKGYRDALQTLETRWFAPFRAALENGAIANLTLIVPGPQSLFRIDCRRGDRWKFWRRPRSLADSIRAFAAPQAAPRPNAHS